MSAETDKQLRGDETTPAGYDDTGIKKSIKDLQKSLGKLGNLSGDIDALRRELEQVKKDMRAEVDKMKKDMKAEVDKAKNEMQQQMQQMKDTLGKWYNHLTYNGSYNAIPKMQ